MCEHHTFLCIELNAAALVVGFGATVHILWELLEYTMMQMGAFGLGLTYVNTIHDFIFGLLGTAAGAVLTVTVLWKRPLVDLRLLGMSGAARAEPSARYQHRT